MKSKDKQKRVKINLKNIIFFAFFIIIVFNIIIFYNLYFQRNATYAASEDIGGEQEKIKFSKANKIDVDSIIEKNATKNTSEELRYEEIVLEYLTQYITNPDVPKGESHVVQEGVRGTQKLTYKKVYENGNLVGEQQISATIVKPAFNQIIEIGSGNKVSYVVKEGDIVSVTSDEITVTLNPQEGAQRVTKLKKGDQLEILKIQKDWYYIFCNGVKGWVNKAYTKCEKKPAEKPIDIQTQTVNLDFNMQLNKPSGLTLEQFQKILNDSKDVNKVFAQNAEYFYYIEQQYNINGVFVASIGIHESAWGTSKIAINKKNLFGYGAYDSNPYNGAYNFANYSESIDLIARVLVKYYLNPKGTSIYGGEKAIGTYYTSPTLTGINKKYATDKNWANGVYKHMQYLYGKLHN